MNATDEREKLIDGLYIRLTGMVKNSGNLKNELYMLLDDYEITKRCTELAEVNREGVESILKRFLVAKMVEGCSERTIGYYNACIRKFFNETRKSVENVTADDIRLYMAIRLRKDRVTKVTVGNEIRCVSSFFLWVTAEEIIEKNPMLKVDRIKSPKVQKKALTEMEIERLRMTAQDEREQMIIEVLLSTGCRVSELVQIRIDEIRGNEILVHGKGAKDRKVYLNARAELTIQVYLSKRQDNNPYLLPRMISCEIISNKDKKCEMSRWWMDKDKIDEGHSGTGTIESMLRRIAKKADVEKANPHKFRRTCATLALRRGMPIEQVSKMLGHENISTTQIYLDVKDEDLKRSHEKYVL